MNKRCSPLALLAALAFVQSTPAARAMTFHVAAGSDLQSVLNAAQPADVILLAADAIFRGNFVLPNVAASAQDILIQSDAPAASLPANGARVTPSFAPMLPKLVSPNSMPALQTAPSARQYRLVGIELTVDSTVPLNSGIVALGDGSKQQSSLAVVPTNLTLDRCYIHGNPAQEVVRSVALNSANTTITGCYISDFHLIFTGSTRPDAQAIAGWNGPGPFDITNCYLEAGDENVLFGGQDPSISGLVPSNIKFMGNHCTKPLSWRPGDPSYAGKFWRVKNLFELKNAQTVLIEGNVFENVWINSDQRGGAIGFTPRNQDGTAPWSVVQDVTFRNNIVQHAVMGINFLGEDDTNPSQPTRGILIENNRFLDLDAGRWSGPNPLMAQAHGRWLQIIGRDGGSGITVNHNTALQSEAIVFADGTATTGFVFQNNISPQNRCVDQLDCGVGGTGTKAGNDTLMMYFPGAAADFQRNVIPGASMSDYPSDNFFPPTLADVGFNDPINGDYHLASGSMFKGRGTDGKDPGCDIDALAAATVGAW